MLPVVCQTKLEPKLKLGLSKANLPFNLSWVRKPKFLILE